MGWHAQIAFGPDGVEDLADHVERGDKVRTAVADEQANRLADLGGERLVADRRADGAIEHDILRPFVHRLGHAEGLQPLLAVSARGVEIALHEVVLVIDLGQALLRFDQDQSVHTIGDMHDDWRGRAMIDEQTGVQRLEREHGAVARRGQRARCAATGAVDRMQVDVVRILVVGVIVEMHLDLVALAHPDELARHVAAKCPERVPHAVGKPPFQLPNLEMHDDLGRMVAVDRRGHVRRVGQDGVLLADNRIGEVLVARGAVGRPGGEHRRQDATHQKWSNAHASSPGSAAPYSGGARRPLTP